VFEKTGGLLYHQKAEGIAGGGATQLNPGLKSRISHFYSQHNVITDGQAIILNSYDWSNNALGFFMWREKMLQVFKNLWDTWCPHFGMTVYKNDRITFHNCCFE
jgi:hypothetical protein